MAQQKRHYANNGDQGLDLIPRKKIFKIDGLPPENYTLEEPHIEIVEQPASSERFRYFSETEKGHKPANIQGANSTEGNETFPSFKVVGFKGRAFIFVSCVNKDPPHRVHPHTLFGKDCIDGVGIVEVDDNMTATFTNLGIQCVRKKDIKEALENRAENGVDPFRCGFAHDATSINLNVVLLCIDAVIVDPKTHIYHRLAPVLSNAITCKKVAKNLVINGLSQSSASASTPQQITLLYGQNSNNIKVHIFERINDKDEWRGEAEVIHKQFAITLRTPKFYKTLQPGQSVKVSMQLYQPKENIYGEQFPFQFTSDNSENVDCSSTNQFSPQEDGVTSTSSTVENNTLMQSSSYHSCNPESNISNQYPANPGNSDFNQDFQYMPGMGNDNMHIQSTFCNMYQSCNNIDSYNINSGNLDFNQRFSQAPRASSAVEANNMHIPSSFYFRRNTESNSNQYLTNSGNSDFNQTFPQEYGTTSSSSPMLTNYTSTQDPSFCHSSNMKSITPNQYPINSGNFDYNQCFPQTPATSTSSVVEVNNNMHISSSFYYSSNTENNTSNQYPLDKGYLCLIQKLMDQKYGKFTPLNSIPVEVEHSYQSNGPERHTGKGLAP